MPKTREKSQVELTSNYKVTSDFRNILTLLLNDWVLLP